ILYGCERCRKRLPKKNFQIAGSKLTLFYTRTTLFTQAMRIAGRESLTIGSRGDGFTLALVSGGNNDRHVKAVCSGSPRFGADTSGSRERECRLGKADRQPEQLGNAGRRYVQPAL